MKISISDMREYRRRWQEAPQKTAVIFKTLGIELRDKYELPDREAIDILHGNDEGILKILERQETEGK
jgi:hypothetical protein